MQASGQDCQAGEGLDEAQVPCAAAAPAALYVAGQDGISLAKEDKTTNRPRTLLPSAKESDSCSIVDVGKTCWSSCGIIEVRDTGAIQRSDHYHSSRSQAMAHLQADVQDTLDDGKPRLTRSQDVPMPLGTISTSTSTSTSIQPLPVSGTTPASQHALGHGAPTSQCFSTLHHQGTHSKRLCGPCQPLPFYFNFFLELSGRHVDAATASATTAAIRLVCTTHMQYSTS
ncbi:hypothetical protein E2P81_ATG09168 [Venturia nashicola]|nr:hypothetical protein E2P81_ATG09168 [Venturia nashicola]